MRLARAVYSADLPYVKSAMANGQSPNQVIEQKPLIIIAFEGRGNVLVANELIAYGADINQREAGGGTALMEATMWGNSLGVKLLLEKGADVNALDDDGNTALLLMGDFGNEDLSLELTKALLEKGADPCVVNNHGLSPVQLAAGRKLPLVVHLLEIACFEKEQASQF